MRTTNRVLLLAAPTALAFVFTLTLAGASAQAGEAITLYHQFSLKSRGLSQGTKKADAKIENTKFDLRTVAALCLEGDVAKKDKILLCVECDEDDSDFVDTSYEIVVFNEANEQIGLLGTMDVNSDTIKLETKKSGAENKRAGVYGVLELGDESDTDNDCDGIVDLFMQGVLDVGFDNKTQCVSTAKGKSWQGFGDAEGLTDDSPVTGDPNAKKPNKKDNVSLGAGSSSSSE